MTGPEHYAEAEILLGKVTNVELPAPTIMGYAAMAQVHATLALVAVTAVTQKGPWQEART